MEMIQIKQKTKLDFRSNESFKALRTNIQFCGADVKVIGITSCRPSEGKSSVSMSLAISFAEAGKKVLLLDADMRKSVLVGRYKIGRGMDGLSHFLSKQARLEEVVCHTDIPNFNMILAGQSPPNPAELLGSNRFKDVITHLRGSYDYIIIDNAPLGSVIDAAVVAQVCDGMVLAIEANQISRKFAKHVVAQIQRTECPILGAILNKVDVKKTSAYGGYGGYGGYGVYGDY